MANCRDYHSMIRALTGTKRAFALYVQPQIDFTFVLSSILSYLWYTLEKLEFIPLQKIEFRTI